MILNEDYRDILLALNAEQVDFILIGAYALAWPREESICSPEPRDWISRLLRKMR